MYARTAAHLQITAISALRHVQDRTIQLRVSPPLRAMTTTPPPEFRAPMPPPARIPVPTSLDLAMVGNCQYSALIDRQGCVVWMCLPRFDGDPVFCS